MFHSGKELPSYLEHNFKQLRLFNPTLPVYFLTDYELMDNPLFEKYDIWSLNKDDYYSDKIRDLELALGRGRNDFWTITATRFIYIENCMRERMMINVVHFENDVLIYFDINKFKPQFRFYPTLAITPGGPDKFITGFMVIKNYKELQYMTTHFISILKDHGVQGVKKQYNLDMVNEMTLMHAYNSDTSSIFPLPTLPFGMWSSHFYLYKSIFDPASWGQFVGGTTDGIPGAKPKDHYIGQLLLQHPEYTVIWKEEEKGKVPYFKYDGEEVRINNLHIHSKNLHLYTSK